MMDRARIVEIVKFIVNLLCTEDYESVVQYDREKRLSKDVIKDIISEYGGKVTTPPASAYEKISFYWTKDENQVNIDFDLWVDHIESDLTLQANIKKQGSEYLFAIDDIHVL